MIHSSLYESFNIWIEGINKGAIFFSPKYFRLHLEPSSEELTFEGTNTMTSRMHLFSELDVKQVGGEFSKDELYWWRDLAGKKVKG